MRLALFLLVGVLTANLSGLLEFAVSEPCVSESASAPSDNACPPTCTRCHCARPFDLVVAMQVGVTPIRLAEWTSPSAAIPDIAPADILHVPRSALL
jgi:hypothetical protein